MIVETIIRFGIIILFGILIIAYYYFEKNRYLKQFQEHVFHEVQGVVIEVLSRTKTNGTRGGVEINHFIKARYKTPDGRMIEAISKKAYSGKKTYESGDSVGIKYCEDNPSIFFLTENSVLDNLRGVFYFGLFVCILGIVLMVIYWPR